MTDTVKVHISIQIDTEGDADTGITVEQWNALTNAERSRIVSDMWSADAGDHDNGGMYVITDGAADI